MPRRLRPTAATAADAVLVGDPGRALLLAQELLTEPKMSNHARGLWGYFGETPGGRPLTVQSTGMGGPSAALVLSDLAELGVERAVRVGTCVGSSEDCEPGEMMVVSKAIAAGGSAAALGVEPGAVVSPDRQLTDALLLALAGEAETATIASVDAHPSESSVPAAAAAADMQTAPLLAHAPGLGVAVAVVLIAGECAGSGLSLAKEDLEELERRAGRAAAAVLST